MKYFNVTIIDKGKKRVESLYAEDKRDAVVVAKKKLPGIMVVKAVEAAAPLEDRISNFFKNLKKGSRKKVPLQDKIATIRQIAVMTDAGIAINETLTEVGENTTNQTLRDIYLAISSDINAGKSMTAAFEPYREDFGHVAMAMTELGERTGNITGAYHTLADILENLRDNTAKFKKAIRSPIITLVAMGIAFTILIMVVVPKFKGIFEKFKTELPIPTQILLKLEHILNNYGLFVLGGLILIIVSIQYFYKNSKEFKYYMDKLMIHPKFYLINEAVYLSTMYNYTLVFGELVKAGIPVAEALDSSVGMVTNSAMKEKFKTVNANIGRGMSLGEAFQITGLFENMLLQMIKAGEKGGQLETMLDKVTGYYHRKFADLIDNLSSYIEPIMMFFIAGLVLLMALGIFMPMWDLGKAVKGG